jgi:hypothetical protein
MNLPPTAVYSSSRTNEADFVMRRRTAACLGLLLLCLEPFSGSSTVIKTSGMQKPALLKPASSSQQSPTIVLGELTWESRIFFPASNNQLDAGLADVIRSADPLVRTEEPQRPQLSTDEFCSALTAAAEASNIPVAFFARLIWQESRFKLDQISPAGAQGVAQFMPRTASEVGLDNPFDPLKALPASARFLHRLRDQFGNLGLAAAAYNAGSGRIQNWLARREPLPAETQTYVRKITGSSAESWALESKTLKVAQQLPAQAACEGTAGLSRNQTDVAVSVSLAPAISNIVRKAKREAAEAARAAKAVAAAKEKLRTASIKLKKHNIALVKSSGSASRTANAKRRATKMASASER